MLAHIAAEVFAPVATRRQAEIRRRQQQRFVSMLIGLAADPGTAPGVSARADAFLKGMSQRMKQARRLDPVDVAVREDLQRKITAHLERPAPPAAPGISDIAVPPGSPIGAGAGEESWFGDLDFAH